MIESALTVGAAAAAFHANKYKYSSIQIKIQYLT